MAYNGWTNKETWLVNLWIGDIFTVMLEDGESVSECFIESIIDDMISDIMESNNGFLKDLFNCALNEINYRELAEHYETEEESDND